MEHFPAYIVVTMNSYIKKVFVYPAYKLFSKEIKKSEIFNFLLSSIKIGGGGGWPSGTAHVYFANRLQAFETADSFLPTDLGVFFNSMCN